MLEQACMVTAVSKSSVCFVQSLRICRAFWGKGVFPWIPHCPRHDLASCPQRLCSSGVMSAGSKGPPPDHNNSRKDVHGRCPEFSGWTTARPSWTRQCRVRGDDAHQRRAASRLQAGYKVMVEVRDARLPLSSAHPLFREWARAGGGTSVVVFTHAERLSPAELAATCRHAEDSSPAAPAVFFADLRHANTLKPAQVREIKAAVVNATMAHGVDRAAVVGLPNVGKSSLITPLTRQCTAVKKRKGLYHLPQVEDVPGKTRGLKSHWLTTDPPRFLVDSPGLAPSPHTTDTDPEAYFKLRLANVIPPPIQHHRGNEDTKLTTEEAVADYLLWRLNAARRFQYVPLLGLDMPTDDLGEVLRCAPVHGSGSKPQAVDWWLQLFHSGKLGSVMLDNLPLSPPGGACPLPEFIRGDTCVIYRNNVAKQLVSGHVMINSVQPKRDEDAPLLRARGVQQPSKSKISVSGEPHWVFLGERRYRCLSFNEAALDVLPMRMRPKVKEKWGYTRKLRGQKKQAWKAAQKHRGVEIAAARLARDTLLFGWRESRPHNFTGGPEGEGMQIGPPNTGSRRENVGLHVAERRAASPVSPSRLKPRSPETAPKKRP